jgi:hypothetical protein
MDEPIVTVCGGRESTTRINPSGSEPSPEPVNRTISSPEASLPVRSPPAQASAEHNGISHAIERNEAGISPPDGKVKA